MGFDDRFNTMMEKGLDVNRGQILQDAVTRLNINLEFLMGVFDNSDPQRLKEDMKYAIRMLVSQRTIALSQRFEEDLADKKKKHGRNS